MKLVLQVSKDEVNVMLRLLLESTKMSQARNSLIAKLKAVK